MAEDFARERADWIAWCLADLASRAGPKRNPGSSFRFRRAAIPHFGVMRLNRGTARRGGARLGISVDFNRHCGRHCIGMTVPDTRIAAGTAHVAAVII